MRKYSTYVGMDVHARLITCQACVTETGEVATKVFANCPTATEVSEWLEGFPKPVYAAYESAALPSSFAAAFESGAWTATSSPSRP